MSSAKLAVLDFDIPQLFNNKIFIPEEAVKVHHTILPTCFLYEKAKERGIEIVTRDVFLAMENRPKNTLLISSLITPYTQKLIEAGARPTLLMCMESPFIATRFYVGLKKYSSWFKHSMVYPAMQKRLSSKTKYHQTYFPDSLSINDYVEDSFESKKLATFIAGNKRFKNWKKMVIIKALYGMGIKNIYPERQKLISYYAKNNGFDLYGKDWELGGETPEETAEINKVYKGTVGEKKDVLRQYKFVFCFENTTFPGFVTEKIFDSMISGSIPVYYGASDVLEQVPKNCFIDYRDFKTIQDLDRFMRDMTEAEYGNYRINIKTYLASDDYKNTFSQERYAKVVLDILEKEFTQNA